MLSFVVDNLYIFLYNVIMDKYIEDVMLKPGGSATKGESQLVHGKKIWKEHPLYSKLYPYRCRKYRHAVNYITVVNSIYNWILAGNQLNKGERVIHIDGNSLNDSIDNLIALTGREQWALYGFVHNKRDILPVQLIKAYIKVAQVKYRIGELYD